MINMDVITMATICYNYHHVCHANSDKAASSHQIVLARCHVGSNETMLHHFPIFSQQFLAKWTMKVQITRLLRNMVIRSCIPLACLHLHSQHFLLLWFGNIFASSTWDDD